MIIELDMYQTLAIAVVVLMLGKFLRKKCSLLEKFCIPAPVVGGVLFAVFTCVCYVTGLVEFTFAEILKEVCMVFFLTIIHVYKHTLPAKILYAIISLHKPHQIQTDHTIQIIHH